MAELKTKPTKESVSKFLSTIKDAGQRADAKEIVAMMGAVTGEKPVMWGPSIVGFGSYVYHRSTGKGMEWPVMGFSPRKANLTLYLMDCFQATKPLLKELGKHKAGGSCLYIKSLKDVDTTTLKAMMKASYAFMMKGFTQRR